MKILSSIFILSLLNSSLSIAATVKCKVAGAKAGSIFADFIGGAAVIGLESGDMTLYNGRDGELLELAVVSDTVSSFKAPRGACNEGSDTVVRHDGSLRLKIFRFSNCVHHVPGSDMSGYVRADITVDFFDNTGKYRELFLTPTGTPPSGHIDFEDCGIDPLR